VRRIDRLATCRGADHLLLSQHGVERVVTAAELLEEATRW
jgi:hypothetical protein